MALLAVLFSLGGFLIVRQMIAPMRVLENHMRSAAHGAAEPISPGDIPEGDSEVAGLFRGYNTLVHAERERANFAMQLAEEEKLSAWVGWHPEWPTKSTTPWAASSMPWIL